MTEAERSVSYAPLSPLRFLSRSAVVWRDRTAVVDGDRRWTYAEHQDRVERLAAVLRERYQVGAGDRVATLLPNVAAMLELHYAVPGVGAVLVPLNTRLAAPDYAYILEHSGARLLVAHRSFTEVIEAVSASGAALPQVCWVGDDPPTTSTRRRSRMHGREPCPCPRTRPHCCRSTTPRAPPADPRA